jgi:transcriptional regulator NrdR family protein
VKQPMRARCPKCGHGITTVIQVCEQADGRIARRRKCASCDHRWFTAQEPEYVVPRDQVAYRMKRMVLEVEA